MGRLFVSTLSVYTQVMQKLARETRQAAEILGRSVFQSRRTELHNQKIGNTSGKLGRLVII